MKRSRAVAVALVALAALLSACGSTPGVPIGIKEVSGDIVYADRTKPTAPPPVRGADPFPSFPGFLSPPAPRVALPTITTTPPTTAPPRACPEDDPLAVPAEAPAIIPGQPLPGAYRFRQSGSVTSAGRTTPLVAEIDHRVDRVTAGATGAINFDVGITENGATTTTTYSVVRRGAQDGLYLAAIRTNDAIGTSSFTPSSPVQLLPTPTVKGTRFSSAGTDPLGQVSIVINGTVTGKTRVNACGTPVDAWLVTVGSEPQTGAPSRIVGPQRNVTITGTYAVATQFGGLIVAEDLVLDGTEGGDPVTIKRQDRINATRPGP